MTHGARDSPSLLSVSSIASAPGGFPATDLS